jgi:hypothetical protein
MKHNSTSPIALLLFLFPLLLSAQNDTTIYNVIKAVEANEYLFRVPEKWKNIPQIENSPLDEKFEFTTVGLPLTWNDAPLTAFLILRKLESDSIQQGENFIVGEFTGYTDRIQPAGETYEREPLTIASGEEATLIHSRFYRRSKVSNVTRYDLVAYSAKRKASYILTMSFQYKDPNYRVEADLNLKRYALRVFKTLVLR